ncbi:pancreatic lipase-related protein 2-like [Branchiostoma lanceolatum]|uniref:pancreatic lipase-related protein 2-like n=1 Tax=Branchiostoma lanceolatum TaxID=7740 RepID=UPI0034515E52
MFHDIIGVYRQVWTFLTIYVQLTLSSIAAGDSARQEEELCMSPLGCFSTAPPFSHLPLPWHREVINTKFLLRTRSNPDEDRQIHTGNVTSLMTSNFEDQVKTYISIHGFTLFSDIPDTHWRFEFTKRLLERENANVFFVDWQGGSQTGVDARQAASNVRVVASELVYFCKWLQNQTGVSFETFHLVGFSFGSQVAGLAGGQLENLGRITGMDPAAYGFEDNPPDAQLDETDAMFVDVIHTDGEIIAGWGPSIKRPIGHVDFYPNGGLNQPGCDPSFTGMDWYCDHSRAYQLFLDTLDSASPPLRAYRCDSYERFLAGTCMSCRANRCMNMGMEASRVPRKKHVKLYLHTTGHSPYRVYHYSVKIHFRPGRYHSYSGTLYVTLHGAQGDTEEISLNGGELTIEPRKSRTFLVTTKRPVGKLQGVTFRWAAPLPPQEDSGTGSWFSWFKKRSVENIPPLLDNELSLHDRHGVEFLVKEGAQDRGFSDGNSVPSARQRRHRRSSSEDDVLYVRTIRIKSGLSQERIRLCNPRKRTRAEGIPPNQSVRFRAC